MNRRVRFGLLTLLACLCLSASGQTGEWVWMGGSSTVPCKIGYDPCGQPGVYGALGTPAAGNVPGGRYGASHWADLSGHLWLFGGFGAVRYNYFNDLWEFNPSTNEWAWMGGSSMGSQPGVFGTLGTPAPGNIPGGRVYAANWTDSSGNFWLFGGEGCDGNGNCEAVLNDLWMFNPSTKEWTWMSGSPAVDNYGVVPGVYGTLGTPAPANVPGSRIGAQSWTDHSGNLWLFGGYGVDVAANTAFLNDLWKFDPSTKEWTWMGGSDKVTCNEVDRCIGPTGVYGTLREPAAGNVPGGRTSAAGWLDSSGHLWLFGGKGNAASGLVIWLNDMWEFNTSTNEWAWMGGSSKVPSNGFPPGVYGTLGTPAPENIPGGRDASSRWTGSGDYLWLFGGWGADANDDCCSPNDLWKFNPSTDEWAWMDGSSTVGASAGRQGAYGTLREPAAGNVPGGRSDAASWTDSRGNLWLFGGDGYDDSGNDGWLNDLWVYQLTPGRLPATTPAFSVASGSYDSQQILKIADATPGAAIYYTLDGSTPTNKSDQYKTELAIAKTITVKAISEAAGYANSAVATATYVILKPQTITFTSVVGTVRFGGKPIALAAKASSGLAVKFSVVSGPAKVNGSSLTLTGVGKVVVAANQAGNSVYAAAPEATLTLEVYKGLQTIAFAQPASPVTYGVKPIDLSATASSGLAVTFWMVSGPGKLSGVNDATLTITGAGTVEVAAIQAGNADYGTAPSVTRTLTVDKATLSVTANNLSIKQGAAVPTLTYSFAGFVNGDTATSGAIIGKPALSTTATSKSPAGSYPIAVKAGTLAAKNYEFTLVNGVLTINP